MNQSGVHLEYEWDLDGQGKLSVIRRTADHQEIPIDPTNRDYCKFVTWAADQGSPVAATFGRLQKNCIYVAHESEIVSYCKQNGVVLLCDLVGNRPHLVGQVRESPMVTPIAIDHDPQKVRNPANNAGRILFYRLCAGAFREANKIDAPLGARFLPLIVSHSLHTRLHELLVDENSEIRSLSTLPVERTFVYVDVSGFSQHPVEHQLLIINSLIQLTTDDKFWRLAVEAAVSARKDQEANLCIGDGYIFVFRKLWSAAYFAAHLAALIEGMVANELLVDFHFRISVHTGPVFRFWDKWGPGAADGRWNYVGRGITDGERVLSAIGKDKDDVVFLSGDTRKRILVAGSPRYAREIPAHLQNRGRHEDKHKTFRRLYELNHTSWVGEWVQALTDGLKFEQTHPTEEQRHPV